MMDWLGLEETLQFISFHPSHAQGHLPLVQVAPSPIQLGLETGQCLGKTI